MNKYDENGLLIGLEYPKTEEGLIDWRKLIPSKYLVVNKQRFEKFDKPIPTSIDGLSDKELLILLAGIKHICKLRRYISVEYPVIVSSPSHCTVSCKIKWAGNIETNMEEVIFSAVADATIENTSGFGSSFLAAIAENRAFVRCVRNFLNIDILGADELPEKMPVAVDKPNNMVDKSRADLKKLMKKYDYSLGDIKTKLIAAGNKDIENYSEIEQLPANIVLEVIGILKQIK